MHKISLAELSIILVEASDTQRKIISAMLAAENVINIETLKNVTQAIEVICHNEADLVVSAMYFEDGTGLEIFKSIKNSPKTADIPFMLVSSESRSEKLEEFKQAGIAAILPKPFNTANLSRVLKTTLDLINAEELTFDLFDVQNVRVLLVDDSRLARNHIRRVLESLGLDKIKEAENGAVAQTLLSDNIFDLLITDYNMPEMDSRELSEFVRFSPETAHIPIIMVTSEATDSLHMANISQTGVNALCDKPFEIN